MFLYFLPICVSSDGRGKDLHNCHPDHGAVAEVEDEQEDHRVEDGQPVHVVGAGGADLLAGHVGVELARHLPAPGLPIGRCLWCRIGRRRLCRAWAFWKSNASLIVCWELQQLVS